LTIEIKKLLLDIQESVHSIDEHLEGRRSFNEYVANKTKRRAVEREFEIIGEAISKILKIAPDIHITYARLIVDLRNKVIHAYDAIDDTIIWKIIIKDLPKLKEEVSLLLTES
jgi:uncharacterized protein with HEPN domain